MFDRFATNMTGADQPGDAAGPLVNDEAPSSREVNSSAIPEVADDWAFFFDIDGTLADIADTPDQAKIPQDTLSDLAALQQKTGLALVSGRTLSSIDELTKPYQFPAASQHGLAIRLADNAVHYASSHQHEMTVVEKLVKTFQAENPGLIVEYKGLSVAIHYRLMPGLANKVKSFLRSLLATREDIMCLQHGKMVDEIKLRGGNKGTAVAAFMKTAEFHNKVPVFAGDDETDEDGFRAVNKLGGVSIQVGSRSRNAVYSISSPHDLRSWIKGVVAKWMPGRE